MTFQCKLDDETPVKATGTIFRLSITTIPKKGGMNFTSVDGMAVTPLPTVGVAYLSGSQNDISLDAPGKHEPMHTFMITPPSRTPNKAAEEQDVAKQEPRCDDK
jgi:hypothetical protein